jgi:L-threonylcarbamoyladenylate synthase
VTRVLRADDVGALGEAARALRAGGLVAFPTETVYGLGGDAFDARAVARIFEAKRRPAFDPLIVHLAEASWLPSVAASLPLATEKLAARFWPGPLTLVLPRAESVPDIVTSGLPSVGVRVPDHPAALALITAAGTPVAAPSANPFGYVSPTTAAHVAELLGDAVDLILDGGPCRVGVESTIVSLLEQPPALLRPGGVPREEIEELLGQRLRVVPSSDRPQAPGQLTRHYATSTPLAVLGVGQPAVPVGGGRVGLLARQQRPAEGDFAAVEVLAPDGQPRSAAANFFAALRRLDGRGLDLILAEPWPEQGLGLAIMDRLRRCAAGRED